LQKINKPLLLIQTNKTNHILTQRKMTPNTAQTVVVSQIVIANGTTTNATEKPENATNYCIVM